MSKITEKKFNKNMLIMLVSIMVGAILVTYFAADILRQSKIDDLQGQIASQEEQIQIKEIEIVYEKNRNINFTNNFLKSAGVLDLGREFRANGSYHFNLGRLFYSLALSEHNVSTFNSYKNATLDNCTFAKSDYLYSDQNFQISGYLFNKTKNFTDYPLHIQLINNYINLTNSGSRLVLLLLEANTYLKKLAENLTIENGTVFFNEDVSELWGWYNETMVDVKAAEKEYNSDAEAVKQIKPEDIEDLEYSEKPDFNTNR